MGEINAATKRNIDVTQLVSIKHCEVFEIHTMPKEVMVYTMKLTKNVTQYYKEGNVGLQHKIPKGAMTLVIRRKGVDIPEYVNFVPATRRLSTIHNKIKHIREALNHPKLEIIHHE